MRHQRVGGVDGLARVTRMPTYPIRAVARMTGLSVDTLRAWERRYEAVVPVRGHRGRLYSDADVARLRSLGALVSRGHSIGSIARLGDADLAGLLEAGRGEPAPGESPATVNLEPLIKALDSFDLQLLEATLNRHAVILPPPDLVFAVVLPLLREVGQRWEGGLLRPSQEHLVSAVVRSVLGGLLRTSARVAGSPTILFATPAGERHELGLLCAAVLVASAGGRAVYLGPDLPAEEIGHAAANAGAAIVVLSSTAPEAVTRRELKALAEHLRPFDVWIGGPGARTLVTSLGGRVRHIANLDSVKSELANRTLRGHAPA